MQVGQCCLFFGAEVVRENLSISPEQGAAMVAGGDVLGEFGGESVAYGSIRGQADCELAKSVIAGAFRGGSRSHLGVRRILWVREF